MDKKKQAQMINEWSIHGTSFRKLASKYKMCSSTVHRMIAMHKKKQLEDAMIVSVSQSAEMPDNVTALQAELRKARLMIELQDLMLDISSKELGVDLRKKHGTRQSK